MTCAAFLCRLSKKNRVYGKSLFVVNLRSKDWEVEMQTGSDNCHEKESSKSKSRLLN